MYTTPIIIATIHIPIQKKNRKHKYFADKRAKFSVFCCRIEKMGRGEVRGERKGGKVWLIRREKRKRDRWRMSKRERER